MAGDHRGVTAGASEEFGGKGAREFQGIEIGAEDALFAVGDGVGFEGAAVRGGQDNRQIAADRFDVAAGGERRLAGRGRSVSAEEGDGEDGDEQTEGAHEISWSGGASGARLRWVRR